MPVHVHFWHVISTHKLGQINPVFGVGQGFVSRSVHARSQVSVCSVYDMCHHSDRNFDFYTLTPVTWKTKSNWGEPVSRCTHIRCTGGANWV